ncbi:hypothetical protein CIK90_00375 [Prevotella sp. P5-126]|nr:hypothetical protein CIK90_00375 [Prevotella sp. P5-126]
MPHKLQIYPEDDIKWQTLPNYKSVVSCRPFQKNKIIGWKLKIRSSLKLLSVKLRFFLELCAVFEENHSCHLAEETMFFVVGIQTA